MLHMLHTAVRNVVMVNARQPLTQNLGY